MLLVIQLADAGISDDILGTPIASLYTDVVVCG
jgi:hypothetical protein